MVDQNEESLFSEGRKEGIPLSDELKPVSSIPRLRPQRPELAGVFAAHRPELAEDLERTVHPGVYWETVPNSDIVREIEARNLEFHTFRICVKFTIRRSMENPSFLGTRWRGETLHAKESQEDDRSPSHATHEKTL